VFPGRFCFPRSLNALFVLNNAVKPEADIKLHPISPPAP
jgi:hypothetical protein